MFSIIKRSLDTVIKIQFTEEKLGQVTDRTEYDDNFEQLLARADRTKLWTEKLTSHVETVLQPNPSKRIFFLMTIR